MYLGDFKEDGDIFFKFTTRAFATGIPTTLANTPVLSVYIDEATATEKTTGETYFDLDVDFDSKTGLNNVRIDLSGDAFFATGADYSIVITTGTVDSVSVVGEVVGTFSIENRSMGQPAGATLADDISAIKSETATIVTDTNEIQGKLPTNKFMGSSDGADDDGTLNTISTNVSNIETDTQDIQGRLPAALASGNMKSDVLAISGDATAADNLELQYDTTGLAGDTFPATQAQLAGIANVGAAVNTTAASYTLTTGTQSSGTVASTAALDGTNHEHTDDGGAMDLYYEFTIGSGVPTSVTVTGYLNGNNDNLEVYGYDWAAPGWVQIGTLAGKAASTNEVNSYDLFVNMVGTGGDTGKVRVRFTDGAFTLSTATLAVDQIFVSFSVGIEGYENGAIWIDTTISNTNTVVGIDGTARNPVSTIAAANTLSVSTNLNRFMVAPGSTITFAATQDNQLFIGHDWTLALGGQSVANSFIEGATVSGIFTGTPTFADCNVGAITGPSGNAHDCLFDGTVTANAAGNWTFHHCASGIAGATTPIFDFGTDAGVSSNLTMADWSNGIELRNYNNAGTDRFSISGQGQIIYAASCSGTVNQRGDWKVTNTGGVTITEDDNTANVAAILVDTTEIGTAGAGLSNINLPNQTMDIVGDITGDLSGSVGSVTAEVTADAVKISGSTEAADDLEASALTIVRGTVDTVTNTHTPTTTEFQADDITEATADHFNGRIVLFTSGVLKDQATDITDYEAVGGIGQFTVTALTEAPSNNDTFVVV